MRSSGSSRPNEVDALILENELIKANQPRYNMRLKDDKSFPFVALDSRTPFAAPYLTRAAHVKGVRYFGPFGRRARACARRWTSCCRPFRCARARSTSSTTNSASDRPCLLYDIGKCSGPCVGAIDADGYRSSSQSWARFFEGDVRELRGRLQRQMRRGVGEASTTRPRPRLATVSRRLERAASAQSVVLDDHSNLDVIAVASDGIPRGRGALSGALRPRHRSHGAPGRPLDGRGRPPRSSRTRSPTCTSTPESVPDGGRGPARRARHGARARVPERAARHVPSRSPSPSAGKRRRVVELAIDDAGVGDRARLAAPPGDHNVRSRALQELGAALGLEQPPYRIECFDMSHLQGTNYVGSMVVFEDAPAGQVRLPPLQRERGARKRRRRRHGRGRASTPLPLGGASGDHEVSPRRT